MRGLRTIQACALTAMLAGCSHLPVDGPNHYHVEHSPVESITTGGRDVALNYVLVDIDRCLLDSMIEVGPDSFFHTFGTGRGGPPDTRIGVGDVLSVSIFESSAGGLFTSGEVGGRPSSFVTLPPQTVDPRGFITVPYAGSIKASGQSVASIQKSIEKRLADKAIEPQVIVALQEQTNADVAVFGDGTSGTFKSRVHSGGERVLDVIARAGIKIPGYEALVTLQRKGKKSTIYFPRLIDAPSENIFVQPGDVVYVHREPQKFVAVGALSNVSQTQGLTGLFTFDSARLSLAEAVARAGGLLDNRADGRQVLLYRFEYREVLERNGLKLTSFPPDQKMIPTIYRANYRDPSVFFVADQFQMRNRDVIYVANSDSVEVEKFFGYVRLWTGTAAGITSDFLVTRDAARALGQ